MQELQGGDPAHIGSYRLVGRLGAGGMGRVFLGRSAGGRLVAVKVIREELAGDADFRTRFRREVAGARLVSGLFTAPVVDADLDGPAPWLATAYVPGPSLADAVASHGPLPAASVLALAAALAEGLSAIHAAGVIHRDLKPSNVLLAADGPRIIDFGISRAAEATALTHTGLVMGSPGFMSPEQAEGQVVGPPSDVFSLGAVLTFAATGAGPFGAGSTAALVYRVVHSPPGLEQVPAQVRAVIERCLAKDPGQRPAPADLLAELGAADLAADWLPVPIIEGFAGTPADPPDRLATVTSAGHAQYHEPVPAPPGPALPQPGSANAQAPHRIRRATLAWLLAALVVAAVAGGGVYTRVIASPAAATRPQPPATGIAASTSSAPGSATNASGSPRPGTAGAQPSASGTSTSPSAPAPVPGTSQGTSTPPQSGGQSSTQPTATATVTTTATATATPPPPAPKPTPSTAGPACSFIVTGALSCDSTNPTVSLYVYFEDDTSACTFTRDITWGDGTSSVVVVQGGPAGAKYVTSHTYAAPGTFSIYFGSESIEGACTDAIRTYTFQLLPG